MSGGGTSPARASRSNQGRGEVECVGELGFPPMALAGEDGVGGGEKIEDVLEQRRRLCHPSRPRRRRGF